MKRKTIKDVSSSVGPVGDVSACSVPQEASATVPAMDLNRTVAVLALSQPRMQNISYITAADVVAAKAQLVDLNRAAEILGMSRSWMQKPNCPIEFVRIGSRKLFRIESLLDFVESNTKRNPTNLNSNAPRSSKRAGG